MILEVGKTYKTKPPNVTVKILRKNNKNIYPYIGLLSNGEIITYTPNGKQHFTTPTYLDIILNDEFKFGR